MKTSHFDVQFFVKNCWHVRSRIARFMGPTWDPPGPCRPQMGPMLAPWTLLSAVLTRNSSSLVPHSTILTRYILLQSNVISFRYVYIQSDHTRNKNIILKIKFFIRLKQRPMPHIHSRSTVSVSEISKLWHSIARPWYLIMSQKETCITYCICCQVTFQRKTELYGKFHRCPQAAF